RRPGSAASALPEGVREELGITGGFAAARRGAMARTLAIEAAHRQSRTVRGAALQEGVDGVRRDPGLLGSGELEGWLESQEIGDVERFFQGEAHVRWADALYGPRAARCLGDHLRSTGEYGALLARARDKDRVLAAGAPGSAADVGMTEAEL